MACGAGERNCYRRCGLQKGVAGSQGKLSAFGGARASAPHVEAIAGVSGGSG